MSASLSLPFTDSASRFRGRLALPTDARCHSLLVAARIGTGLLNIAMQLALRHALRGASFDSGAHMKTEPMPLWIRVKQATARASDDVGGDKVLAAVTTRITHSARFSDYANLNKMDRVVPFDAALEVDRYLVSKGRVPHHTQMAADELGYLLVPMPKGDLADCDMAALCKISTESAEAISTFALARADGVTTPDEAVLVRQKLADAQTAFAELDERMARIARGEVTE